MVPDDLLGERQAEPAAALLGREEGVEQARQQLVRDADPVVLDLDLDVLVLAPCAQDDVAATLR
jgi:hypothetical protein